MQVTSPVPDDPRATIEKAKTIRAAAHAPVDPSSQDRAVAAAASMMEAKAQAQLTEQQNVRTGMLISLLA